MLALEWTLYDKSNWPEGEWKTEPDKLQWQDEATGYPCLIVRNPETGVLCGYVGTASKHPLFGSYKGALYTSLEVHGSVNYADKCFNNICHVVEKGEDDNIWWLGFDCNHAFDLAPIDLSKAFGWVCPPELKEVELHTHKALQQKYRNVAYVKEQCQSLAMQLKEMESGLPVE